MSHIPMSDSECELAMSRLTPRLRQYAELLVRRGVAIQSGQELVVTAPVESAPFVRIVVEEAYKAGAGHVTLIWGDDEISRLEYDNCPVERFQELPAWKAEQMNSLARGGAAFLWIDGEDPDALLGIDPAKPAARAVASHRQCADYRRGLDFGVNAWCIAGAPVLAWARKVFPDYSDAEAIYRLWVAILDTARVTGDDPESEWETHNATLKKNKRKLNDSHFDALRYTSSNGTNLVVGMTPHHLWEGGSSTTKAGVTYFPNMPTEEVFTSPDRNRVEGVVHSALPLVHNGSVIRDFWLTTVRSVVWTSCATSLRPTRAHATSASAHSSRRTHPFARAACCSTTRSMTRTQAATWRWAWGSPSATRAASTWTRRRCLRMASTRAPSTSTS